MRIPVVSRTRPLNPNVPRQISTQEVFDNQFISIKRTFLDNQKYFAIEVLDSNLINSADSYVIAGDSTELMAFLMSSVFPIWVNSVNRSKNKLDPKLDYNNFPFPNIDKHQSESLVKSAKRVYEARGTLSGSRLSDIYETNPLPEHLLIAHEMLDAVVLKIFGLPETATNEEIANRLFEKYLEMYQKA